MLPVLRLLKAVHSRSLLVFGEIKIKVKLFWNAETERNCTVLQFGKMDVDRRTPAVMQGLATGFSWEDLVHKVGWRVLRCFPIKKKKTLLNLKKQKNSNGRRC